MDEVTGQAGELMDRLITLLNCDDLGECEWYDLSFYVVFFIGGSTFDKVVADTGKPPTPGSVGERVRQHSDVVSRARYFELIRGRLNELILGGVEEAFLVRSMRDAIRRLLESMTEVGKGDHNRAELRAHIRHTAEDPIKIAEFRTRLAADDPAAKSLSNEEIAAKLRKMAETEILLPSSPDVVLDRWASLTHWDQHAASLLPDAAFDEWRLQMTRRRAPAESSSNQPGAAAE